MTNEEFQKLVLEKFTSFEEGQKSLVNEVKEIRQSQIKIEMKIEQTIEPKIQALYEDRDIVHKKLDSIENEVKNLSSKVERQELEIRVIRGGKDGGDSPKPKKKRAQ